MNTDQAVLDVSGSVISGNHGTVTNDLPAFASGRPIEMSANSGAIHAGENTTLTIEGSLLVADTVSASDPQGQPITTGAALLAQGPASVTDTTIRANSASWEGETSLEPGGGVLEFDSGGRVEGLRLIDNSDIATTTEGPARDSPAPWMCSPSKANPSPSR